jgi:hypothetical protein
MISFGIRRDFPAPSMTVFFTLQALDVLTTLIGLRMGEKEASMFVGRLLVLGPVAGLLVSKCFAVILASAALAFHRPRVIVFLNLMFAAVVTWNLATIVVALGRLASQMHFLGL